MKLRFSIPQDLQNTRLDAAVSSYCQACSRSMAATLVDNGNILVNMQKKKPAYKVKPGDQITGDIPDSDPPVLSEKIDLNILFEDEHIMVIDKAPGMVIHPGPGNLSGTLVNALLFHDAKIGSVGEELFRSGIVHRLDKDTSGLMVIAKTTDALEFLKKEFKQRRVEKRYLALVSGHFSHDQGEINLPIGRHPVKRKLMSINPENGKPARTLWKVIKQFKTACLVEVLLKTGRTHQIRVHFYAIDHPLVGDLVYQPRRYRKKRTMGKRQMLHSWQLAFRHPHSGQAVFFEAGLPGDFLQVQAELESME